MIIFHSSTINFMIFLCMGLRQVNSHTMKEQLKASRVKILAALLVFSMLTQGMAVRVKGVVRNGITDEAVSAKTTLGAGSSTAVNNHHAIPRDQYSSHGGEDGSGGSGGDTTKN
ncbi:hypothetical protein CFC21_021104 [Triticum aestivum]|uniref:Uncharacterized protein n=2 Tax=Triticum aestivum TaxID=4565 RepID=A0A3B6BYF3_WHEAT|nr:hypothetical protein CFC21_021104 [Triticum aestivum]